MSQSGRDACQKKKKKKLLVAFITQEDVWSVFEHAEWKEGHVGS